jgi:SAM-dependent methyltransferase
MDEREPNTADAADWPPWVCPNDGLPLDAEWGCPDGHRFTTVDGIPRFVPPTTYADAFGAQWLRYRRTQLDSHTGTTLSRERARRCIGEEAWGALRDAQVLECGCGAGRFTEVLLEEGARVTSVDLSTAVDANAVNFPPGERHRIAQADIRQLPFEPRGFDIVFCLGVVQHTPDPEATIAALYEHVRPGGTLVIDHYRLSWTWFVQIAPLLRLYVRRLDPATGLARTESLVERLMPVMRRASRVPHARLVTRLLKTVVPISSYYHVFPELTEEQQVEWAKLDTHDALTDRYKHLRTRRQIESTLRALGLEEITCTLGGNGIEARGRRPRQGSDSADSAR